MVSASRLTLDTAKGQTRLPKALQVEEGGDKGGDGQQGPRDDLREQRLSRGASGRGRLPLRQTHRDWEEVGRIQHDERKEIVVPGGNEGKQQDGHESRNEQAQRDREKNSQV